MSEAESTGFGVDLATDQFGRAALASDAPLFWQP
jgi:hypothetical protein